MFIDYLVKHQTEFWLALGFVFLALEVIMGFSSGIFLFTGLGSILTGGLMFLGILPQTWLAGMASTGISSGLITLLLWSPMKKLQGNEPVAKDNSSDLIGHTFTLQSELTRNITGTTQYSGITWKVQLDPETAVDKIEAGKKVAVTSVEVGLFWVKLA